MSYLNKVAGVAVAASVALGGMATSVLAASIVSFNGPAGEAYVGRFIKGIKETAALKGFDILTDPQGRLMLAVSLKGLKKPQL